jgi:hypothetical protein
MVVGKMGITMGNGGILSWEVLFIGRWTTLTPGGGRVAARSVPRVTP